MKYDPNQELIMDDVYKAFLDYSLTNELSKSKYFFLNDVWEYVRKKLVYNFGDNNESY